MYLPTNKDFGNFWLIFFVIFCTFVRDEVEFKIFCFLVILCTRNVHIVLFMAWSFS